MYTFFKQAKMIRENSIQKPSNYWVFYLCAHLGHKNIQKGTVTMKGLISGLCLLLMFSGNILAVETDVDTTVETLQKTSTSWDNEPLPCYAQGTPEITILRITIPAGAQLPMHKHPVINAGILVTGQLTVVTENGKTLHLKAGDTLVEVVDKWHYGKNEGNTPAEIIVFYAGAQDMPRTTRHD